MSNLLQLRANSFLKLAESSGATFSDLEMNEFINREYEHLQAEIITNAEDFFAKSSTFNSTTNETYQFPQDMFKLLMLECLFQGRWLEITRVQIYQKEQYKQGNTQAYIDNASGTYYYIKGDCFGIVPVRTTAGINDLRITYVPILPVLDEDTDIPLIPALYHELLEIGAVNRARMAIKEPPIDAGFYAMKFDSMLNTIVPRVKNNPRQIRMIRGMY